MSKYLVELVGRRQAGTMNKSYTVEAESESSAEKNRNGKAAFGYFLYAVLLVCKTNPKTITAPRKT